MTISIRTFLAQQLDNRKHADLGWDEVSSYIRVNYIEDQNEKDRRARALKRERLYRNDGAVYMHALIDATFSDTGIRDRLKKWAETAAFDNFLARIVNEHSTVYQEPAIRTVGGGDDSDDNQRYQLLQSRCDQHAVSTMMNAKLTLHRAVLVGFKVRNNGTIDEPRNAPVMEVVTPDQAFLIGHPNDPRNVVGVGVRIKTAYARGNGPAWVVWTEHEWFWLDRHGGIVGKPQQHDIGRIPYVFVSLEDGGATVWPGKAGEDLVNAAMAIWFSNVSLMKEQKASTKIPTISGDTTAAVRAQAADTEVAMELPDGTSVSTLELGMDLGKFTSVATHISEVAANNHGLSSALLRHQGVQSADARDLMRVPLREIRMKQQVPLRKYEREFVDVQLAVLGADGMTDLMFAVDGWSIDFADPQTPRSVKERNADFRESRQMGLDNTVAYLMRSNPDLDAATAKAIILMNIDIETWRVASMKNLIAQSGSMGTPVPDPNSQRETEDGSAVSEEAA